MTSNYDRYSPEQLKEFYSTGEKVLLVYEKSSDTTELQKRIEFLEDTLRVAIPLIGTDCKDDREYLYKALRHLFPKGMILPETIEFID